MVKAKEAAGEKYIPRTTTQQQQQQQQQRQSNQNVLGRKRTRDGGDDEEEEQVSSGRRRAKRPWSAPESSETDPDVGDIPMPGDTPPPIPRRRREDGERQIHALLPEKVVESSSVPSQAVYESKPVLRDLRKEATAFVPAAVRKRQADGDGGALPVPIKKEELRDEPSVRMTNEPEAATDEELQMADVEFENDLRRLEQADVRWRQEAKQATVEEVVDEDA